MKIGSIVECVSIFDDNNSDAARKCGVSMPVKNHIYTVRDANNSAGIRLMEIVNRAYTFPNGTHEPWFYVECFREIQFNQSAIEELLEKKGVKV